MKKTYFLVLILALVFPGVVARAAGEFDYIVIKGPGITGDINVSNPLFTADINTFADFSKGSIETPADPGQGYQIVRMHAEGSKGIPTINCITIHTLDMCSTTVLSTVFLRMAANGISPTPRSKNPSAPFLPKTRG